MKVLQVHADYRIRGGENVVVERESAELEAAGHTVIRYAGTNDGAFAQTMSSLALAPWNPGEARRMERIVEAEQPDVMHVHNTWFGLSPAPIAAASKLGIPIVHTLHNSRWVCVNGQTLRDGATCTDCVTLGRLSAVRHRCYRSSLPLSIVAAATGEVAERAGIWKREIDRFVVLTRSARDRFASWGFPKDRIVVRPHRIADPGTRQAPPSDSNTVLYVGRLSEPKGVEDLCRIWSSRQRRQKLVVIGDGPIRAELEANYRDVTFLGQLPYGEVINWMLRSRALILPTRGEEAFGLVVVEAMACGIPVALSDVALIRDYVAQVDPDWVYAAAKRDDCERVFALIDDDEVVREGGARARQVYQENFAEDDGRSLIAVYQDAIDNRKARRGLAR
ncbi:MAG: glycosyltransferase family 4 protein [Acidimicrobiia bacterium]